MTPLVSLCVPTFNASRTLAATIRSLLGQTYSNLEILISDNASEDDTVAVARSFGDRVVALSQDENIGAEGNFQRCFRLGRGKYTGIFHADDIYEPEMVAKQVAFLESQPDVGAVFVGATTIDEEGRDLGDYGMPIAFLEARSPVILDFPGALKEVLRFGNFLICPSFLVRTEIYRDEIQTWEFSKYRSSADLDVWFRILKRHRIGFLPEKLLRYRKGAHSGSYFYHHLRTARADFFLVIDAYLKDPEVQALLDDTDRLALARLEKKDQISRAIAAILRDDPVLARTMIRASCSIDLIREAVASNRGKRMLLAWLLAASSDLGGQAAKRTLMPLLHVAARRASG
jgi:glycosyltransferase involved in cell wall biosynthesis